MSWYHSLVLMSFIPSLIPRSLCFLFRCFILRVDELTTVVGGGRDEIRNQKQVRGGFTHTLTHAERCVCLMRAGVAPLLSGPCTSELSTNRDIRCLLFFHFFSFPFFFNFDKGGLWQVEKKTHKTNAIIREPLQPHAIINLRLHPLSFLYRFFSLERKQKRNKNSITCNTR